MKLALLGKTEAALTALIGVLVVVSAGAGVFVSSFYQSTVDPEFLTGTITADLVSLLCVPLLGVCILSTRRGKLAARMIWISLPVYLRSARSPTWVGACCSIPSRRCWPCVSGV